MHLQKGKNKMTNFMIAQLIAVVICVVACGSYFAKKKSIYLFLQLIVNILYGTQYFLLGQLAGTVSNAVSSTKYVYFIYKEKVKKENTKTELLVFLALSVILGILAIDSWFSVIPIVTSLLFTYAIWQKSEITLRAIVIFCNLLWVVFNLCAGAYVSALYSFAEMAFATITMIKLIKLRRSQDAKDSN